MNDRQDRRGPRGPRREGDRREGGRGEDRGGAQGKRFGDKPRSGDKPRFGDKAGFGGKPAYGKARFDDARGERPRGPARGPARPDVPRRGDPEKLARADKDGLERIAKVIARAGIASRRDAEEMIAQGRVAVNGEILTSPALDVGPDADIRIDGEALPSRERTRLWLFHKPVGLVSTTRDPEGRPTVFEALPEDLPRVMSVGRLDINTEGLLLFTNDGGLARVLSHPETGWLRRYRVRAYGHVDMKRLEALRHGVAIDGEEYGPIVATVDREQGDNTWLTLDLREGRNREVKNVLEHVGLQVNRLIRVSFGPFQLGEMKEGETEEVRTKVLKEQLGEQLARIAEVQFDGPVRTPAGPARREGEEERPRRAFRDRDEGRPQRPRPPARPEEPERPDLLLRKRDGKGEIWRDEETKGMKPQRSGPRRGVDPREDRERREQSNAALGRERTRAAPIADPKGRRVTVERVTGPSPEIERKPRYTRDDFRPEGREGRSDAPPRREEGDRPPRRSFGDRPPRGEFGDRPPRGVSGDRPPRRDFGGRPPRRDEGDRPPRRAFSERPPRRDEGDRPPRRDRSEAGDRPFRSGPPRDGERSFRPRPEGDRPQRPRRFEEGERPRRFEDRPPRAEGGARPERSFRPRAEGGERPFRSRPPRPEGDRPRDDRPRGDRPFRQRPDEARPPRGDRPFRREDDRGERRGPPRDRPQGDRPYGGKPHGERPAGDPTYRDRPFGDRPRGDRPGGKPFGDRPSGGRGFGGKPSGGKPFGGRSGGDRPRSGGGRPPSGGSGPRGPRKPR